MSLDTKVYKLLMLVPKGKVTTYKAIADALGTKGYQAIGTILNKNPHVHDVPCYRVVNSDGTIGGYSKGIEAKVKMLKKDGIEIVDGKIKKFEKRLYHFRQ